MRVCLIGTSNSIFARGYAAGIAETRGITFFKKHSMGASPSIIIPYFSAETNFKEYDWLVIDTAINDRNYYIHNSITPRQIREFLEYGICNALENECKPFLLLMPSLKGFGKKTISGDIYHKVAAEHSIPIFDGFKFIENYASLNDLKISECFKDDFHVLPEIAFKIGESVAQLLLSHTDKMNVSKNLRKSIDYRVVKLSSFSNQFITRRNSLTQSELALFDSETKMTLDIKINESVCGVVYNSAKTNGNLKLSKIKKTIKQLTTKYLEKNKNLLIIAVPITGFARTKFGNLELSMSSENECVSEASRFSKYKPNNFYDRKLEIESIIIKIEN